MKNKKGITFGRIMLYILFAFVIVFLIWSLVLTYRSIRNPNTSEPKIECDSSIKFAPNRTYSALDYIDKAYLNFYNSNSIARDVSNSLFSINVTGNLDVGSYDTLGQGNVMTAISANFASVANWSPFYTYRSNYLDNTYTLKFGSMLYDLYFNAKDINVNLVDDPYNYNFNYFGYDSIFNSAAVVLTCDIPVELFNFSINGFINSPGGDFYVFGSSYNGAVGYKSGFDSTHTFTYTSLPSQFLANYTRIKKIVIPTWQFMTSNEPGYYIVPTPYNYSYNDITSNYSFNFVFQTYTESSDWQEGYDVGYQEGLDNADRSLVDINNQLQNQVSNLNGQVNSLQNQVAQQSNIINNLNIELQQLQTGQFTFKNFFFSIADVPFKTVHSVLGFDFFGVNLFNFFVGILTALGIIWLIKKIL